MVNRANIDFIPKNTFFGFDHLMNALIMKKLFPNIYEYEGYWFDIGRPDDYAKAIKDNKEKPFLK